MSACLPRADAMNDLSRMTMGLALRDAINESAADLVRRMCALRGGQVDGHVRNLGDYAKRREVLP